MGSKIILLLWGSCCSKLLLKILSIRCSKHFLLIRHAQVPKMGKFKIRNYEEMNNLHDSVISFALRKNSLWTAILVLNQLGDLKNSSLSPQFMLSDFNFNLCRSEAD